MTQDKVIKIKSLIIKVKVDRIIILMHLTDSLMIIKAQMFRLSKETITIKLRVTVKVLVRKEDN